MKTVTDRLQASLSPSKGRMDCTSYRHRWEMPLVRVQIAVSLLGLYAGLAGWIASKYVLLLLVAPMFIFVSRFFQIARDMPTQSESGPTSSPSSGPSTPTSPRGSGSSRRRGSTSRTATGS